jgi:hypothetical protein
MAASARPCTPVPLQNLHGKEGVDGSSPSEGFAKSPANRQFLSPHWQTAVTRGHARGLAGVPSMVVPTRPAWLGCAVLRLCDPLSTATESIRASAIYRLPLSRFRGSVVSMADPVSVVLTG